MDDRIILHIVDPDSRTRAEIAQTAFALGHHAEVYATVKELAEFMPDRGLALVRDYDGWGSIGDAIRMLSRSSVWLPVIATATEPETGRIVEAVRDGAFDYLGLPLTPAALDDAVSRAVGEAGEHAAAQRRLAEARQRIDTLTPREREVLDWLVEGQSNKAIAHALDISPRTVEIHRSNMMAKLGARHPVDAVRIRLDAKGGS
ncbi:response regulator transcription factor [Pelagerythrobacter sp.]|uniref:response regulator transcription factor n=1 Tax=Pelagerythrobacter sp. TaxID=2800702 RepID=UPI0035B22F6A